MTRLTVHEYTAAAGDQWHRQADAKEKGHAQAHSLHCAASIPVSALNSRHSPSYRQARGCARQEAMAAPLLPRTNRTRTPCPKRETPEPVEPRGPYYASVSFVTPAERRPYPGWRMPTELESPPLKPGSSADAAHRRAGE